MDFANIPKVSLFIFGNQIYSLPFQKVDQFEVLEQSINSLAMKTNVPVVLIPQPFIIGVLLVYMHTDWENG